MSNSSANTARPSHHGRLTTTDASFLYLERESAPMHIGALGIVDGEIDVDSYLEQVKNRLRKLPRFRERVVPPPLYVGHPTWESDPNFDSSNHVKVHRLESPGSIAQLRELTNRLIEGQMDRSRPLWEIHIVEGVEGGKTGLVSKVHHAMVDGVGGNAIMLTLFDLEPHPPEREFDDDYQPSKTPKTVRRVGEAMWDNVREQINVWSSHLTKLTEIGQAADFQSIRRTVSSVGDSFPDLMRPPKRLPFNRACNGKRDFAFTEFSFTDARAVRRSLGGTLNDVVLATLGSALGKYARHHGQTTKGVNARVMVPVNMRPATDKANLGNLVSILPVQVALDIEDPSLLLKSVRSGTRSLKDGKFAEGVSMMTNLASAVPAPFQAAFGAIAVSPYPLFNLVCTNVPGPQIPLYAQGHRLEAYYPIVPVGFDMGVCCALFSYAQKMYVGLNSDVGACSDIDTLRDFFDEAFAELKALAVDGDDHIAPVELKRVRVSNNGAKAKAQRANTKKPAAKAAKKKSSKKKPTKKKPTKKKPVKKATAKKKPTKKKATAKKKPTKKKATKKKPAKKKAAKKKAPAKAAKKVAKKKSGKKKSSPKKSAAAKSTKKGAKKASK